MTQSEQIRGELKLIYMTVDPSIKEEIASAQKYLSEKHAFVGFDGFVDKIVSPIDKVDFENQTQISYPPLLNLQIEFIPQLVKAQTLNYMKKSRN